MAVLHAKADVKVDATATVAAVVDVAAKAAVRAARPVPMAAVASPVPMVAAKVVANHGVNPAANRGVTPAPNRAVAVVDVAANVPSAAVNAAPNAIASRQKTKAPPLRWTPSA